MSTLDNAVRLLQQGKLQEGERILKQLRRRDPDNPDLLYNLGMAYSEQGKFEPSIEVLEQCIALAPQMSNAYTALGFSYSKIGKYHEAAQKSRQALEIDPDNFYAWRNIGGIYGKLREHDKAIEAFKKADALQKDQPDVLYGMALVYEELGDLAEADRLYTRIIQQNRSTQFTQIAERARTRIAHDNMRSGGLPRMDAVMYLLSALQKFEAMDMNQIRQIGMEIALLGRQGLQINDPAPQYTLRSLPGHYSGLQLLAYMHVAFYRIDPSLDVGSNLEDEFAAAKAMHEKGSGA
jgi:tetratricopeptide (TPR) repeat protein